MLLTEALLPKSHAVPGLLVACLYSLIRIESIHSHTPEGGQTLLQHALTPQGLAFLHGAGVGCSFAIAAGSVLRNSWGVCVSAWRGGGGESPDRIGEAGQIETRRAGQIHAIGLHLASSLFRLIFHNISIRFAARLPHQQQIGTDQMRRVLPSRTMLHLSRLLVAALQVHSN